MNRNEYRKIKIRTTANSLEFVWQCPHCLNVNYMNKSDISMNRSYSCWNCNYTWTVGYISDDIRDFLKKEKYDNLDQRPRIVR